MPPTPDRGICSQLQLFRSGVLALLARSAHPANARVETRSLLRTLPAMTEIIFEVREDEADGGYVATALGHAIATQGETMDELRDMVRDAVKCHFGDGVPGPMPRLIRLHFVRDEVLAT